MDCIVGQTSDIRGGYLSVNPLAIRSSIDVFTTNRRLVTHLYNPKMNFECFYVMVGATLVGSCVATAEEGTFLRKGSEFGYFCFGGSTVVLVFKPNTIVFDDDILRTSKMSIEVLVQVGQSIAKIRSATTGTAETIQ
uniref:Phosphatidylserine decarboxylase proenzyme 3 n=1 Tax=Lygus hesperus TaxID=30085 RepID=A0A0A9VV36_LYGHE